MRFRIPLLHRSGRPRSASVERAVPTPPAPVHPPTLLTTIAGRDVRQMRVFDPALRHYGNAYRLGGPLADESPTVLREWRVQQTERSRVVLQELTSASVGRGLVLRGGWLLYLWFGDQSRDPRDLDFVDVSGATPETFVRDAITAMASSEAIRRAGLLVEEAATTDIWTYERAVGRRLVLPWRHDELTGAVQIDVTFGEEIPGTFESVAVGPYSVRCASKETSLVWKLMWLLTDSDPQGKDFFDAALLSKHIEVSPLAATWLRQAVKASWPGFSGNIVPPVLSSDDWGHFATEYPELASRTSADELHRALQENLTGRTNGP